MKWLERSRLWWFQNHGDGCPKVICNRAEAIGRYHDCWPNRIFESECGKYQISMIDHKELKIQVNIDGKWHDVFHYRQGKLVRNNIHPKWVDWIATEYETMSQKMDEDHFRRFESFDMSREFEDSPDRAGEKVEDEPPFPLTENQS